MHVTIRQVDFIEYTSRHLAAAVPRAPSHAALMLADAIIQRRSRVGAGGDSDWPLRNGNAVAPRRRAPSNLVPSASDRRRSTSLSEPVACALVIAGVARTGRLLASELIDEGFNVSAMSFTPAPFTAGAHAVEGDITDVGAVRAAMSLVDAVVIAVESGTDPDASNSPHAVHLDGVEHVVAGVSRAGMQIVLITQAYDARPRVRELSRLIEWRKRGEQALRESSIAYTIVRPPSLTDETGGQRALRFEQGDGHRGQVSRADLARTCTQCLLTTASHCKTFGVYEDGRPATTDWEHALAALAMDQN
jgi:uncharacterized protein YbjT (DUF2867 family)